jgi:carbonic anhydrase/acetyltransferase-like protein (isoleucine patch superfamily)
LASIGDSLYCAGAGTNVVAGVLVFMDASNSPVAAGAVVAADAVVATGAVVAADAVVATGAVVPACAAGWDVGVAEPPQAISIAAITPNRTTNNDNFFIILILS